MYDLDSSKNSAHKPQTAINKKNPLTILFIILAVIVGFGLGLVSSEQWQNLAKGLNFSIPEFGASETVAPQNEIKPKPEYTPQTTQEEAVVKVVQDYSPAVVSIIITKNVPIYERYYSAPSDIFDPFGFWQEFQMPQIRQKGTQEKEVGAGSGFIISDDGMIITNKHVVSDENAQYTIITAEDKKYPAKVLALDPAQDLAIVKVTSQDGQKFPTVKLGDSSKLQIGQTVIAIGNALGEFNNTVSVGVISGLRRSIVAGGGGMSETLENLIQTDAAINEGNSGGPLLNLKGEVIGVNTAMASGAQNVGFVLPINFAKRDIEQVKNLGKISYPFLGIYYTVINDEIQKENNLPVNYGAWINANDNQQTGREIDSVLDKSPAQRAGLKDQDIILELNGEKITQSNTLSQMISKYNPGDKINLKVRRGDQEINLEVTLGDRSQTQQ